MLAQATFDRGPNLEVRGQCQKTTDTPCILYQLTTAVETCVEQVHPTTHSFSDLPLSEGFSKFVVIASFWFSSVALGFALFSPTGAKYEDIHFMTLTCHASCLNLP